MGGNLTIGTATAAKTVKLHTGGTTSTNLRATVADTSFTLAPAVDLVLSGSTSGTTTLKSAAIAASSVITFPAATGTVALTSDITNFAWGASVAGTSGTGLTLTLDNASAASTVAQLTVVGNTQSRAFVAQKIDL
jgi:hypothetical protein